MGVSVRTHLADKTVNVRQMGRLRLGRAAVGIAFCLLGTVSCSHLAPQATPTIPTEPGIGSKAVTTQTETPKEEVKPVKTRPIVKKNSAPSKPMTARAKSAQKSAKPVVRAPQVKKSAPGPAPSSALEKKFAQWKKPHQRMKIIEVKKSPPPKRAVASEASPTRAKVTFSEPDATSEAKRLPRSLPAKLPPKRTLVVRTGSGE
jgi:hypothetical protein